MRLHTGKIITGLNNTNCISAILTHFRIKLIVIEKLSTVNDHFDVQCTVDIIIKASNGTEIS